MIKFSNGHELTFCNGAGALAFDGRGWWWEQPLRWLGILDPKAFTVVAKTVTMKPKKGNLSLWHPWTCVRIVKRNNKVGAVNAIGLTNNGIQTWTCDDYVKSQEMGYKIAASVKPENILEAGQMAYLLEFCQNLAYIEVNVSCPNVAHGDENVPDMLKHLNDSGHPIVLKLSIDQVNYEFIKATEPYVEAYHAINTIPWGHVVEDDPSPIEKYAHKQRGGISGDFIRTQALWSVSALKGFTDKPIIGGGGILDLNHVYMFEQNGASAFSIGTCFLLSPWKPNRIVKQYQGKKA